MSQRMTMEEVLKEYGVPQLCLDVHATRTDLLKLREKLMAIRIIAFVIPQYLRISNALRLNGQNPQGAGRTLFPACSTRVCYGAPLVKVLICVFQFGYEYRGYPRIE